MEQQIFVIPIKSITKNPNAGNSFFNYVSGPTTYEIKTKTKIEYDNFYPQSLINGNYTYHTYSLDSFIKYLQERKIDEDITITISAPIETIYTLSPSPEYIIEYDEDTKIKCCECGASFGYKYLEEYYDDYDNYGCGYVKSICPFCNTSECCSIKHESIEEFKIRTK